MCTHKWNGRAEKRCPVIVAELGQSIVVATKAKLLHNGKLVRAFYLTTWLG